MTPLALPDLTNTPGIYYAIAYWLSCTYYISQLPRRLSGLRLVAVQLGSFAAIAAFMVLTDGVPTVWFVPCVCVYASIMLLYIKSCCTLDWIKTGYICVRAFILGEFAAALEWQLFYFGLDVLGLPLQMWVNLLFMVITHSAVFGVMFLLEKGSRSEYLIDLTWRELVSALVLALAVFTASNLSYLSLNTPFSTKLTADIFIIRTLVDLGGVAMLHAYHAQLRELNTKLEMGSLQNMLQMQYNNYCISEDSIALVNQKYHDLKHYIVLLRSQISSEEKLTYLEQMEEDIRAYEAQNKTGNRVLDAILTTKSLQCQREHISLTCVAEGAALEFMHPIDISALFGNALDNAIESVKKLSNPEKQLIHVSMARQRGFLRIRIENCYEGKLSLDNNIPASTKQDKRYHGFGLKSIQGIVSKYSGSMSIVSKDGWFELRILFPVLEEQETETL